MRETSRAWRARSRDIHWWAAGLRDQEGDREASGETWNRPRQGETCTGAETHR
ncbi:MAG: hypothetical protein GY696_28365 [Gammaproteobacteria bacterium]|nr:hypothetical protein [Gammaproteobacteria bacterium]